MKPAREPASIRPKPCASLKKPHEYCPFAAPCGPRRKKNVRSQRSAFPSETSRFALSILAHRGSALPWLVNDRAALRLRQIYGWGTLDNLDMKTSHPVLTVRPDSPAVTWSTSASATRALRRRMCALRCSYLIACTSREQGSVA